MRSEKGVITWGAGEPGEVETGGVGPVGSTGSVPCTDPREGVGWATEVVAAGAFAESSLATVGTKRDRSRLHANPPRPGKLLTVAVNAETRATNLLEGVGRSSSLICGPCVRKSQKSARVRGSSPKALFPVRGISPPKPRPGIGEEGVYSPQALMRYTPPSSTGVRLVEPLRSCSVAEREEVGVAVRASFSVFEGAIECGEELEPSLDSDVVFPHVAYAFQSLVV